MNAEHEEAVEFAKISKRENRVYVGNLSYDVKYRDLMEFMRGGGWGNFSLLHHIMLWSRSWGTGWGYRFEFDESRPTGSLFSTIHFLSV